MGRARPGTVGRHAVVCPGRLATLLSVLFVEETGVGPLASRRPRLSARPQTRLATKTARKATANMVVRLVSRLATYGLEVVAGRLHLLAASDAAGSMRPCSIGPIPFYRPPGRRRPSATTAPYASPLAVARPPIVSRLGDTRLARPAARRRQTARPALLAASQVAKDVLVVAGEGAPTIRRPIGVSGQRLGGHPSRRLGIPATRRLASSNDVAQTILATRIALGPNKGHIPIGPRTPTAALPPKVKMGIEGLGKSMTTLAEGPKTPRPPPTSRITV